MAEKIKLPKGVAVYHGGRKFSGEIPAELCPQKFKKAETTKPATASSKDK